MKKIIALIMALSMFLLAVGCTKVETPAAATATTAPVTEDPGKTDAPVTDVETEKGIAWPERTISVVVGAKPGGGSDTTARLYAKYLEAELGQTVTIVNVAGSNGALASDQVKDAEADGYTILNTHEGIIQNMLSGSVDYSFSAFKVAGVALWTRSMTMVTSSKEFKTFDEMVAHAKANPGTVIATVELGGSAEQAFKCIEETLGIDLQIVDGGATADRITALAGEHADISIFPMGNVKDYVSSGMFTPMCIFADARSETYPDIPVLNEFGVEFLYEKFFALMLPAGTDDAIVAKLSAAMKKVSENAEFQKEAAENNYDIQYLDSVAAVERMTLTETLLKEYAEKYN